MTFPPTDYSQKWILHTCGAVGPEGPTPSQCLNSYRNSNVNVTLGTRGPFKGIQMWRVPETATYRITAYGAAGGRSVLAMSRSHGVYITGDFLLRKGELLYVLVGQQGENACPNVSLSCSTIMQTVGVEQHVRTCSLQYVMKAKDRAGIIIRIQFVDLL
ncbi:leukocyte tyrosine kinase receptor-like [Anarrhichthys ocellatus]|uniref:leukocyte tyrosine kinase receptor-like n=1 Tax=Anarrhichthys ocellatus TaxID=433405 RepID=UPI0012EDE667|nr:leukocyte tyrosine kinase receptor-like [Anarrhichthys ocellatus]